MDDIASQKKKMKLDYKKRGMCTHLVVSGADDLLEEGAFPHLVACDDEVAETLFKREGVHK